MSENTTPVPQTAAQTQADLRQLASSLREAGHLEPDTQIALASLLDELGTELDLTALASAKTTRLAQAVSDVARSLHEQHSAVTIVDARDRMKDAAVHAESEAPAATSLVYRFIDLLASMGI